MLFLTGWARFVSSLRKNPELIKRCLELTTQWEIAYAQGVIDACKPTGLWMCTMAGAIPPKTDKVDNRWIADYWARIGHHIAPQVQMAIYSYAYEKTLDWMPTMLEKGALGWDSFRGGNCDTTIDSQKMVDWCTENGMFVALVQGDKTLLDGPISAIEDQLEKLCAFGKSCPRFGMTLGAVDYWTPPEHVDASVTAAKKYLNPKYYQK